jgi:hypothetical protein
MTKVINLRTRRKQAARAAQRAQADANALRHGETKALRNLREARADKARSDLDGHQRDTATDAPKDPAPGPEPTP